LEVTADRSNVGSGKVRTARASVPGAVAASGRSEGGLPEIVGLTSSASGNNDHDLELGTNRVNVGKVKRTSRATAPGAVAASGAARERQTSKTGEQPEVFNSISGDSTISDPNEVVLSRPNESRPRQRANLASSPEVVNPTNPNPSSSANSSSEREPYLDRITAKQGAFMKSISEEFETNNRHKRETLRAEVIGTDTEITPSVSDQSYLDASVYPATFPVSDTIFEEPNPPQVPSPNFSQDPKIDPPPQPKGRKRIVFLIGLIFAAVIGLVIGIVYGFGGSDSNDSGDTKSPEKSGPSMPPSPSPDNNDDSCYKKIKDINKKERNIEDYSKLRVYTLCPNTTYEIGNFDSSTGTFDPRYDHPIQLIYPNMHIKCGSDGNSSNGCFLVKGNWQVETFKSQGAIVKSPDSIDNVMIQGLTLKKVASTNVNYVKEAPPAHLTVKDCKFQSNYESYFCIAINRRNSSLVVEDSFFRGNTLKPENKALAVIHSELGVNVTVRNSKFHNNDLTSLVPSVASTTVIMILDSTTYGTAAVPISKLTIENSCFTSNKVNAAIVLTDCNDTVSVNNFHDQNEYKKWKDETQCDGVGFTRDYLETSFNCIEPFNASSCAATF
jgi:hypothetical protein